MGFKGSALKISRFMNKRIVPGKEEVQKSVLNLWHCKRNTHVINELVLPFDYAANITAITVL